MTRTQDGRSDIDLLQLKNVSKWFGSTRAVAGVELALRSGEIVGLVGQNGSGKSTVVKMVTGAHRCDAGAVEIAGEEMFQQAFREPAASQAGQRDFSAGDDARLAVVPAPVNVVQQDLALAPGLSVMENIRLDRLGGRALQPIQWRFEAAQAEAALTLVPNGASVSATKCIRDLTESQRTLVALARALWPLRAREELGRASVLLLDETTSRLTSNDAETVFAAVREFIARGSGALVVSHKLDEILSHCDRVIALRNGRIAWEGPSQETDVPSLIQAMTGSAAGASTSTAAPSLTKPTSDQARNPRRRERQWDASASAFLEVCDLASDELEGLNFSVDAGEIVGVAGLPGSGVSTLGRVMLGNLARHRGSIYLDGKRVPATIQASLASGIMLLPENRLAAGLNLKASVAENLSFSSLQRVVRRGRIIRRRERSLVADAVSKYCIVPNDPGRPVAQLSGGNQQKVLLARVVESGARVLLIEDLSRGVDVASREVLYDQVRNVVKLKKDVCALIFSWSDFDDIAALAQRAIIINNGKVTHEVPRDGLTRDAVEAAIYRS